MTYEDAIGAIEEAFAARPPAVSPQRVRLQPPAGTLLLMPAWDERYAGVKLVGVAPDNPGRGLPLIHAVYVLFEGATLQPLALIDGETLTALRTAAVSAVATKYLAREDARHLVLFGAGTQAREHLRALQIVRSLESVTVVGRSRSRVELLIEEAREAGLRADSGVPDAVAEADIVCTCTTSPTPLFDGARLRPGSHVNAVGAFTPETREVDDETARRCRIIVETREAALAEAGDLLIPLQQGVIDESAVVADLGEVVRGASARGSPDDVTLFKSVGIAAEDLAVAAAVYRRIARDVS